MTVNETGKAILSVCADATCRTRFNDCHDCKEFYYRTNYQVETRLCPKLMCTTDEKNTAINKFIYNIDEHDVPFLDDEIDEDIILGILYDN